VLWLAFLLFSAACKQGWSDDAKQTIVRPEQIRAITSASDLKSTMLNPECNDVSALHGRQLADMQARVWNDSASLILVYQAHVDYFFTRAFATSKIGRTFVYSAIWGYVYRNARGDSWLGVIVGRDGILDVGYKRLDGISLLFMSPIQSVEIDSNVLEPEELSLFNIDCAAALQPLAPLTPIGPTGFVRTLVAVEDRAMWAISSGGFITQSLKVIDAINGSDVSEEYGSYVRRRLQPDRLVWLNTATGVAK
jgi:hypothetical protein